MSEKIYKFNDRVEVEMLVDKNGLKKGEKVKVHPETAKLFIDQKIAK